MNCKLIWWNLPLQIKEKLNITLTSNWFKIPTEMNKVLDELKLTKPSCYSSLYPNGHNVHWFNLPFSLTNVCELIGCVEPLPLPLNNFIFTTGTAPSLIDFETIIGFPLLNGSKVNDTIYFDNVGYTIPLEAFMENIDLISVISQANIVEDEAFQGNINLTNAVFPVVTTLGDGVFNFCTSLTSLNISSVDNIGGSTGEDAVFFGISGKTMSLTFKTIHQTSNGGGLEGDLVYLNANNTITFTWV